MQDAVRIQRGRISQGLWSVGFGLTLFAVAALAVHGYRTARRAEAARTAAGLTARALQQAQQLEMLVMRMEADQRGFLVAGLPAMEVAREADFALALRATTQLRPLLTQSAQRARLARAEQLLRERHAQMRRTSTIAATQGLPAARDAFTIDGTGTSHRAAQAVADLRGQQQARLLAIDVDSAADEARFNQALTLGAIALALLLLHGAGTLWLQRRRSRGLRAALAHSDAMQHAVLDSAGTMVIATDTTGMITVFNRTASQTLGYSPGEVIGRHQPGLFHDPVEVQARAAQLSTELGRIVEPGFEAFVALARDGRTDTRHWTYVRRDGSSLRVQLAVSAVHGADGELVGFVGIANDITEQERAHDLLRQNEQHLRTIIDTASDAFIAIDTAGVIQDWNAQAERILGWSREEAVGQSLAELVVPAQFRQAHIRGLERYLRDGHGPVLNRRIEITALDRSGREFPIELTVWPLRTHARLSFNAFIHDITGRKAAQEAIRALNSELTEQAEQLSQTNRELESFSYSVSHDLRAPLRHMSGYAQILREEAGHQLDASAQRYIDEIAASARRMGALIDDLLAFSRLSRQALTLVAVDMNTVVRDAIADAGVAPNPLATIEVAPLPPVQADPVLLRQVWINLISNAVKYSAPQGARALVRIDGEVDGTHVRYRIRDNGVGFDPRYADKLFGVFQRLHAQDEFEGTGVGLAIVQRIVARHRGQVAASAQPGQGAQFTIELPTHEPQAQGRHVQVHSDHPPREAA
ncbi:PAS domain S-box protein [Agrilutibacter solisilvae]|uniref:histidine kinase n=1 Tax=Agrilutibacter solisilvae TaxID=2763317 RepID=A0A975AT06_9GAMM|nr:PAS domain S-box protein [Lysobacter solisilvae]QSX79312.1 PAS domain S-box protein [Lysobacter solisilvae]